MASIENITYKGDVYDISDAKAMHQDAAGSWMPDFSKLKALATYEFDIASTSYYKICERANVTNITDLADEVLAFRITTTGTNIFAVADCVARVQPTVNGAPRVTVNHQTKSTSAATTGIRYLRIVNPKAVKTSYKYVIEIAAYNATARHIKVEVFKTTSDWTFFNTATTFSYNSTNQTATDLTLYDRIGVITSGTIYGTANYATYAGYKSTWDALFNSNYVVLVAGAAIAANQFAFVGENYKVYPVTNTSQPILTAWPIIFVTSAIDSGANCTWSYLRTWGHGTPATSILRDTLAAHDTVYLKCTYTNGKVYSQNRITPTINVGSNSTDTYYKLGVMYNTTALEFNTLGGVYFTVDMDGNMRAINGYLLNADKAGTAATASTVSKAGTTAAGSYGVLLDNNLITDVINTTTSPRVNAGLTYTPSTGILNATGFSGSGAGLTNIPASSLNGIIPLANGGTGVSVATNDTWYDENVLHPRFEVIYDLDNGFQVLYSGPLDGITRISDFYASEYFRLAARSPAPIWLGSPNSKFVGSGIVFTGLFAESDLRKLYIVFPDGIHFGNNIVNGIKGTLTTEVMGGVVTSVFMDPESMLPSVPAWVNQIPTDFTGATSSTDGTNGLVPAPASGDETKFLKGDGTWAAVSSGGSGAGDDCYYGYCDAAATASKKTVTISNSGYTITDHVRLFVYFANAHTYSSSKPYLSIDDVTYQIRYYDLNISAEDTTSTINNILYNKRYMEFYFLTMSGSLVAIALPDAIPTLFSPYRTSNTRITNLNALSTTNGAYMKYVVASSNVTTGKPVINGAQRDAMVLHFNWDNSAAYAAQLAIQGGSFSEQGGIAYRRQNGTTNGWHTNGWRTIADEDNIGTLTDVEHCYTAALTPAGDGTIVFPIDGTKYRITQITLTNYDLNATAGFGVSRMFIANNGGSGGYMLGAIDYFSLASTSTDITMTIQSISGSGMQDSTNLHAQVRYVKI